MKSEVISTKSETEIASVLNAEIGSYLWAKWDGESDASNIQQSRLSRLESYNLICSMIGFPIRILWDTDNDLPYGCTVNGNRYSDFDALRIKWEQAHGIERQPDPEPDPDAIWTPLDDDEEEYLYVLRDFVGYGTSAPVCVTREEAERLCREWNDGHGESPEFDATWRRATLREVREYGIDEEDAR